MSKTKRTGWIKSMDATRSAHTKTLVRELQDESIEYLVGDSARRRDGWAEVPKDVIAEIQWDEPITDEQIAALRTEAATAGDFEMVLICDLAVADRNDWTRDEARLKCAAALVTER